MINVGGAYNYHRAFRRGASQLSPGAMAPGTRRLPRMRAGERRHDLVPITSFYFNSGERKRTTHA